MYYFNRKKVAAKALFNFGNINKIMNKLKTYILESIEEMKKVTWPTKKETYHYTVLILIISLGTAAFLGALDYVFNLGIKTFLYNF